MTAGAGLAVPGAAAPGTVREPVELHGAPAHTGAMPLEEIVRPFDELDRGITFLDGPRRLTLSYGELAGRAAANAGNDLDSVLLLMGVWQAGAGFVSMPRPSQRDAGQFAERFGALLKSCGCAFLVSDEAEPAVAAHGGLSVIAADALHGLPAQAPDPLDAPEIGAAALIQFTSGSVSAPKGVAIGAGTLARHVDTLRREFRLVPGEDRFVSWLPLYHDMGLVAMFLQALAARTDLVLMPPTAFAFGPARWLNTLAEERGTFTAAPDFAYRMAAAVPYAEGLDLSRVRVAVSGGERINWRSLNDFHRAAEPYGFRREALSPSYGLAENVVGVTSKPLGRAPVLGPGEHVSVGRPLAGVSLRAPEGLPAGPLQMRGQFLFDGYYTADGYVPTPADEWCDTGDEGFIADGEVYVVGRRAEVVSMAGRNVFAEDLEAAVHDAGSPEIRACAAFRLQGAEQQFGLMVEVAPRTRQGPDEIAALGASTRAVIREAVGVRVASVLLVRAGTIPRTTSGKVQRAHCRTLHAEGQLGRRLLGVVD
jgi:acyl-CoA synthetase (AMP-forming)/AMP-acid ligase II